MRHPKLHYFDVPGFCWTVRELKVIEDMVTIEQNDWKSVRGGSSKSKGTLGVKKKRAVIYDFCVWLSVGISKKGKTWKKSEKIRGYLW